MSAFAGTFIWHELKTTDPTAAERFYSRVLGWRPEPSDVAGITYTRLMVGDTPCAGLMEMPQQLLAAGGCTGWTGYVGVDALDDAASRLAQAGGTVTSPLMQVPGVGRLAAVADPQGSAFALFEPATKPDAAAPPPGMPGTAGWNELRAMDGAAAFDFYAGLFGWQRGEAIDMGPMGPYQLFVTQGVAVGGIMTRPDPAMTPSWLYYFNVAEIAAATASVTAEGGAVVRDAHQVPGGSWIIHCRDPLGDAFALVAPG